MGCMQPQNVILKQIKYIPQKHAQKSPFEGGRFRHWRNQGDVRAAGTNIPKFSQNNHIPATHKGVALRKQLAS